jgi:hypothetical protein
VNIHEIRKGKMDIPDGKCKCKCHCCAESEICKERMGCLSMHEFRRREWEENKNMEFEFEAM